MNYNSALPEVKTFRSARGTWYCVTLTHAAFCAIGGFTIRSTVPSRAGLATLRGSTSGLIHVLELLLVLGKKRCHEARRIALRFHSRAHVDTGVVERGVLDWSVTGIGRSFVRCVYRSKCITRPINDDRPADQYDQLQTHIDRRKPTRMSRSRPSAIERLIAGERGATQYRVSLRHARQ